MLLAHRADADNSYAQLRHDGPYQYLMVTDDAVFAA